MPNTCRSSLSGAASLHPTRNFSTPPLKKMKIHPWLLSKCFIPNDSYGIISFPYSGETAFKKLVLPYGWAKFPMIHRMQYINAEVKVAMLFGSHSWIDNTVTEEMESERPEQFTVYTVDGAGHHVYADKPVRFNKIVKGIFETCDEESN
jgi:pimeloyl-ACP methyl ester carboxylesterase